MSKGELIVVDGIDGSGKTTQVTLLDQYLTAKNIPHKIISFPQYGQNEFAVSIRKYLEGEMGVIADVDPKVLAKLYASDRLTVRDKIKKWLLNGQVVIANRYVSSSKAHLSANLPEEQRAEFISWVDKLEYEQNQMPREELTIFLDIDPSIGQQNALEKDLRDIHEESLTHMQIAANIYRSLAQTNSSWSTIYCMTDGEMRSVEEIHQELIEVLEGKLAKNF